MILFTFSFVFSGLCMLSSRMDRHAKQIFGQIRTSALRQLCSLTGWIVLASALWLSIWQYGVSIGIAVWFGLLAVAATAVALLLAYRPRAMRIAAPFMLALATALLGIG